MSQNTRHPQTAFRHTDTSPKHLVKKNVYYRISFMALGVAIPTAVQLCSKSKFILQKLGDRKTSSFQQTEEDFHKNQSNC